MRYSDTEKGRSMIETIGYLGVFMVLIAAIGRLVSNVFEDYKYSKASLQLGDLAATITRVAAVDGDYHEVVSHWTSYVPKTFRSKGGKYYHAFNGEMEVSCPPTGCDRFQIVFNNLNKKQCVELAMKDWSKNRTVSLDEMQIGLDSSYGGLHWCWHDCGLTFPVQRHLVEGVDATSLAACGVDSVAEQRNKQIIWIFN